MSMWAIRLLLITCLFLLIYILNIIIKNIDRLDKQNNPECIAWIFPAFLMGMLIASNIVILIATFEY